MRTLARIDDGLLAPTCFLPITVPFLATQHQQVSHTINGQIWLQWSSNNSSSLAVSIKQQSFNMVQFKRDDKFLAADHTHSYWKLGFFDFLTAKQGVAFLKSHGYYCREDASRKKVMKHIGRYQRGLLSYEALGLEELRAICASRNLSTKAKTVPRLARKLERADDQAKFECLFKLPPEIRNIIYEFYCSDIGAVPFPHAQPPLTLASRQLRAEFLPIFYGVTHFVVTWWPADLHIACHRFIMRSGPDDTTTSVLGPNVLAIENLSIAVTRAYSDRLLDLDKALVYLWIRKRKGVWTVKITDNSQGEHPWIKRGMHNFLRRVKYQNQGWKMQAHFLLAMAHSIRLESEDEP